jgi:hypothetical protein
MRLVMEYAINIGEHFGRKLAIANRDIKNNLRYGSNLERLNQMMIEKTVKILAACII